MDMYQIVKVDESELIELQQLTIGTFTETYGALNTAANMQLYLDNHFSTEQLTKELRDLNTSFYGLKKGAQMIAYLKVNVAAAQTEQYIQNALEVERIYVKSQYKGQGLGKELIQQAITVAKSKQVDSIWLGVWEKNANAIAFYEKMGLREFDRHSFKLGDELQEDIMMKLELKNKPMNNIIVQGIQYDDKSSYQQGPKLAPPLIRAALNSGSMNLFAENGISVESSVVADKGDFLIAEYFDIEDITKIHLALDSKILTLGGDHSITYPIIKAHHEKYPVLDILHIDAHADLYHEFEGDKYSHACPFARIMENGFATRLVQVGIRTLNTHQAEQAEKFNVEIHQMKNLNLSSIPKFNNPLYISLDLDGFDPAYAPGVSHHEPGGLSSRQVIDLIQSIDAEVVGADIVEYNPNRDFQDMTAFLAAKMMKEIVGKMMES